MKTKFSLIFLFFILNILLSAQDLRVISSNQSSITVEYKPNYKDTVYYTLNGQSFVKLAIAGTYLENIGKRILPIIPVKLINIGVPEEFGNNLQIISSEYSEIPGRFYIESPIKFSENSTNPIEAIDQNPTLDEPVIFGDYGLIRNLPVQSLKIYPIKINSELGTTSLLKKITFRVNLSQAKGQREPISDFDFSGTILNWGVAQNWGIAQTQTRLEKSTSITAAGDWYRFEAPEEGIYRMNPSFLTGLGIDLNNLDPRTIKIYSNGGYALPESLYVARPDGFAELAIQVVGEQDGKLDASDYILFYGRGPEFWEYKSASRKIERIKHPFSKKNYYWLTYGSGNGKRITEKNSLTVQGAYNQPFTYSHRSNDKDSVNLGKSGRDYFGDELNSNTKSRTYITSLNNIVPGSKINYKFRVANGSSKILNYRIEETGSIIANRSIWNRYSNEYAILDSGTTSYTGLINEERSNLKFVLASAETDAKLFIDYFEIEYQRQLKALNNSMIFFSKDTSTVINYTVTNFSNSTIQVFDITDYANVKLITNPSISGGQVSFQASEVLRGVKKYIALNTSSYREPVNGALVQMANIRSKLSGSELIVVTHKNFKTQAETYANYRSNISPNKVSTSIFYVDDILNEFSNGMMDPTAIRDFLKFAYEKWQTKPKYVLLFGDGDYDYFNLLKLNRNFVPTYQTAESLYEIYSYPMDDYFARVSGQDLKADLAVGRLNIQSEKDANIVISKIIKYETDSEKGNWRNTITLVADDGPEAAGVDNGDLHTRQSEELTSYMPKYFSLNKIYLAAYPTVNTGLGRRKPAVNQAIIQAVNNGTLIINYIGHGNPSLWAHENVFEKSASIPQLTNQQYFFLTAATCDFGKYDDPNDQSATEILVNKENSGAIGAFTAARIVYAVANAEINNAFYLDLFQKRDKNNLPIRIGDAYLLVKQYRNGENDEKYHLFCDPTLRLNEPRLPVSIDSVNNKSISNTVQLQALGEVKIVGQVKNSDGTNSNYNGEAIVSVYDSERQLYLAEMNYTVTLQGGLIYRGRTNITNGKYQTEFVVPKDISYENKNGKIVSYIYNNDNDGIGFTSNITVGGSNANVVNDGKGPEIQIFFDNENFENSYLVNPDFTLIAKLKDQTGLNTTGTGIGHKLEGIINDNDNNTYDFTNFFIGDLNSGGKSGVIRYKFTKMEPGDYKIKVKAWDVFNNFSSQDAYFSVVSNVNGIVIRDIVNYPNPFAYNTTFTFQHNISSPINVKIKVYTIAGRLIKELEDFSIPNKFVKIDWDGRDNDGNNIGNGTYLYKLIVESTDGKFKETALGKIAVIK